MVADSLALLRICNLMIPVTRSIPFKKFPSKAKVIIALLVTYQLDQLYLGLVPITSVPSPFKIAIAFFAVDFITKVKVSKLSSASILACGFALIAWSLITFIWADDVAAALQYTSQLFILAAFTATTLYHLRKHQNSLEILIYYSALFGGIIALLSVLRVFTPEEKALFARLSVGGVGINALSVSVGYIFVLGLSYLFWPNISRYKKIAIILSLAIMFVMLIHTGTRSVVWGIPVCFALAYLISAKTISIKQLLLFVLAGVSMYYGYQHVIGSENTAARLANRLNTVDQDAFEDNVRLVFWSNAMKYFLTHPFGCGVGTANEGKVFLFLISSYREAHNVFVTALVQLGLFGTVILLAFFGLITKRIVLLPKGHLKFTITFLFFFFLFQTVKGSFLQTRLFWHPVTIILLGIELQSISCRSRKKVLCFVPECPELVGPSTESSQPTNKD